MSIRNCIGVPDDRIPAWVRARREAARAANAAERRRTCSCGQLLANRNYLLGHCDVTGHTPASPSDDDKFLKRIPPV
jgi:hypothetical protein